MILLIDNYDSFTYNLYQYIGTFTPDIRVVRNDAITIRGDRRYAAGAHCALPGSQKSERGGNLHGCRKTFLQ